MELENSECYLIDLKKGFLDMDKAWGVINKDPKVQTVWCKLVLLGGNAGAIVKGRIILANSFIADPSFIDDEKSLGRLRDYDLIGFKKVNPVRKPRPKIVGVPKGISPMDIVGKSNLVQDFISFDQIKAFDEFWELYPPRQGQKLRRSDAKSWFISNVESQEMLNNVLKALTNYKQSSAAQQGFVKDAINFLTDWRVWAEFDPSSQQATRSRTSQAQINRADDDRLIL